MARSSSKVETFETRKLDAHYQTLAIQPIEIIEQNGLSYHEACIVKYILRWQNKNGFDDLLKAKWYVDRLVEIVREENGSNS